MWSGLAIDPVLVEQIGALDSIDASAHVPIMNCGLKLLEGKDTVEDIRDLSTKIEMNASKIGKLCSSVSTLLWECSKFTAKDQLQGTLQDLLLQLGLSDAIVSAFCEVFHGNKRRILALKGALGVSAFSYQNLSWRLDVELAKRNMEIVSEPKYLLRLDLINNSIAATTTNTTNNGDTNANNSKTLSASNTRSHHLQADHANMKLLELELQRAVDEMSSVHCQRISRYMS